MFRAVVFDFDGLILDTEGPVFESWRWAFSEHGCDLSVDDWATCIGTTDAWDPLDRLAAQAVVDSAVVGERRRALRDSLLAVEVVRPGVLSLLDEAGSHGVPVGVASSSPVEWVEGHLARLGLLARFDVVVCHREGVLGKPAPDLYVEACAALGAAPSDAVAFEDSMNGVHAAKAAGMRCVAVPHALTEALDLSAADLVVRSLEDVTLTGLFSQWSRPARSAGA
jgi:HAD superfamily hydrolase (TIGR01509 family)